MWSAPFGIPIEGPLARFLGGQQVTSSTLIRSGASPLIFLGRGPELIRDLVLLSASIKARCLRRSDLKCMARRSVRHERVKYTA